MTEIKPGHILTCQECGRGSLITDEEIRWWLVANRTDGSGRVVRCPQHITIWTLRAAGMGRGKDVMEWVAEGKRRDIPPAVTPMASPIIVD